MPWGQEISDRDCGLVSADPIGGSIITTGSAAWAVAPNEGLNADLRARNKTIDADGTDRYAVADLSVVKPGDVSVLDATEKSTITRITCFPFYFVGSAPSPVRRPSQHPPATQRCRRLEPLDENRIDSV